MSHRASQPRTPLGALSGFTALAILFTLTSPACAPLPWVRYPMPQPPDRTCRTGGGVGHDIYIWDCLDGQHIVISRYCGGFVGCHDPEREVTACGQRTALEERLEMYLEECRPPPESQTWPAP